MLTPATLILPVGIINPDWFPAGDDQPSLEERVQAWLDTAATLTSDRAAQRAFVYCAALRQAASIAQGQASEFQALQIADLRVTMASNPNGALLDGLADSWCRDFEILTGTTCGPTITPVGYQ